MDYRSKLSRYDQVGRIVNPQVPRQIPLVRVELPVWLL